MNNEHKQLIQQLEGFSPQADSLGKLSALLYGIAALPPSVFASDPYHDHAELETDALGLLRLALDLKSSGVTDADIWEAVRACKQFYREKYLLKISVWARETETSRML